MSPRRRETETIQVAHCGKPLNLVVLGAVCVLASCSPSWDRSIQTESVYAAVVAAMVDGQIQLHSDIDGRAVAISDKTVADHVLDRGPNVPLTRAKLEARLPAGSRAAIDDYLQRRSIAIPVRDTFRLAVPHEMVSANDWSQIEKVKLLEVGGLIRLSPVGFDSRGRVALVYAEHICGGLCATGHFILLSRESDQWRISKVILAVVA